MFIGHIAVGFAAKRVEPSLPLGLLVGGALLLDLIWPVFLLLGIESVRIVPGYTAVTPLDLHDYPYTHSLLGALAWSLVAGAAVLAARKKTRLALVLACCVFSHWVLDYVTHAPDMPLWPGGKQLVGLGLWNSIPATIAVEVPMFIAGVAIYLRTTRTRNVAGRWGLFAFVGFLVVIYFANLFGPPPPSAIAIAYSALLMWLFLPWSSWIDRNRSLVSGRVREKRA